MTTEYLQQMKADLLSTYRDELCEASIADINRAATLQEFIDVLHTYSAFLAYKSIPKIDWVRKWFADYKDEAEALGCYIDRVVSVTNPTTPVIAYGRSNISLIVTKAGLYNITLQDDSYCSIVAYYASMIRVRQKDNSQAHIIHQDNRSVIKIRKV